MRLLDEIIDLATVEGSSVPTLLRKCLVLAYALKNDRLKIWAEKELNGYAKDDYVPDYRKAAATAKGLFVGPFGSQINNQPLATAVLKPEHRQFADSAVLHQPIASYEGVDGDSRFAIEWPANLTLIYQDAFFESYNLNRAWQEIPGSVFVGLIDTIRTRVLRFALELKDDLGSVSENLQELPKERVDQNVITYIFGGTNVIASRDFTQIDRIEIGQGDWAGLARALETLGIEKSSISELKTALDRDKGDGAPPGLGQRVGSWLMQLSKKSGQIALSIGVEVAKQEATKWISQYLGLTR